MKRSDLSEASSARNAIALQEANANLVIASVEARKVADDAIGRLHHLAYHDALTDLPNRTLLWDRLGQAIELARRQGRQLALLFMDLDGFKHINDSLGHPVGDQLLQMVACRLSACARHSDTVSRQGGDEFIVLLPSIEGPADAMAFAKKILLAFESPYPLCEHDLHIEVSVGISIYPEDGHDAETLIRNADTAMYHAKASGRNNCKFFEQKMNDRAVERQSIEADLRLALKRQEFMLYYQPKIDLASGRVVGVEALIRWQHPQRGLLLPAHFVPIAEECGLIVPIGRWVLRQACAQACAWRDAGLPPITIAVNSSAIEFRARDFLENLRNTLNATSIEPGSLELELTESVLMQNIESAESVLFAVAGMGIKLAIDDFGTGYSSLSYLSRFPIKTLKIDQSFVRGISGSPDNSTIVSAIINMGRSLNRRVIAEGVETREQHEFLLRQHCDEGQGDYYSPALPARDLESLLQAGAPLVRPTLRSMHVDQQVRRS
jgi:diguanylate cyclase (GGDEF)-like protein